MIKLCLNCNDSFNANGNKSYCYKLKIKICKNCGAEFEYICDKRPRVTCSVKCSKLKNAVVKESKKCLNCSIIYYGIHNQIYCNRIIERKCELCGSVFTVKCNIQLINNSYEYCDSICLKLSGGSIFRDKVMEYKNIDLWAKDFHDFNGRKPSINDFNGYFNVRNIPQYANLNFFYKMSSRRSFLEELFFASLKRFYGGEVLRNKRPITTLSGSRMELDFWLYGEGIAFEVNDFTTHSIVGDFYLNKYNNYKHGPFYHDLKVSLAELQLSVTLVHIWEDDILLGYGDNIVYGILKSI